MAYDEATIDELYYLAQEHANREVGPGKEAYNVKVGGMGTPLTGDESRKSWPSTYKVRDKRHLATLVTCTHRASSCLGKSCSMASNSVDGA